MSQHTPSYRSLRAGACWALLSCVQGLAGLDPHRAEGGISDAVFGVVGGRCVLSTGVRLDCPLAVAWPVPLPYATPLLHSDAYSSSLTTCALDWWEKVEGAATA